MNDLRVCFFGDSYTSGQGDDTGLGWPGRVFAAARAAGHVLTAYNLGVRGDTVAQIVARAPAEAKARFRMGDRKAVVFSFGANDVYCEVPREESITALTGGLDWAKAQGFAVFVLSPPPVHIAVYQAGSQGLCQAMAEICAAENAPFLDLHKADVDWDLWWQEAAAIDGVHPGAGAYASLARAFVAWPAWQGWLKGN